MNSRPTVVIVCPSEFKFSDPAARLEKEIIGDAAEVTTLPVPFNTVLPDAIFDADAIILWHGPKVDLAVISRLKNCRAIIRNGVGFDTVDAVAAANRGIPVCNVPDYGTEEVADHAIALILALCRQLLPLDVEAKKLGWKIQVASKMRRMRTLQVGLIGLGRIGTATALRAKAFGCRVVFYDPYVVSGTHKAIGIERTDSLEQLLRESDIVSIHCPLTPETHGLIGERELALMKPSAYLVNTARGDTIQKAPLFAALRANRLAGAGLDVVENEPLRSEDEAATPNLIVTCHAAFCSPEGMIEMRSASARIARAAVLGQPVWNRVN